MAEIKLKELLRKYLAGSATPEEQKLVDDWYEMLSEKKEIYLSDSERFDLREGYWRALKHRIRRDASRRLRIWPSLAVAASVTILVCAVVIFLQNPSAAEKEQIATVSVDDYLIANPAEMAREIWLPDSSFVRLAPGSYIEVSPTFNMTAREVTLSGEAFFDISRNEAKPFYVSADEVTTKVLGTSFTIKAYPNDSEVTVAVKSGSVSVYTHETHLPTGGAVDGTERTDDLVLAPNQQAVYKRGEGTVTRTLVKNPEVVIPDEEVRKIRFEGMAVADIFKALEKMYGVDIAFSEEDFEKCTMTTSANGKDLYERIDVICEITGATYVIEGTHIRVAGSGCN